MSPSPRDAATVVLVRDAVGTTGIDVWLMHRLPTMAFAAGAHVFPGGSVDATDDDPLPVGTGALDAIASVMNAPVDRAHRLVAAAVRETFEECGVVLAGGGSSESPRWSQADRDALIGGHASVASLLHRDGLTIDLDTLVPWAWWLTPDFIPRRYDTWFFLAQPPRGAEPVHVDDGEALDARWWGAADALEANRRGAMLLLPPTLHVLTGLADAASVDDVMQGRPSRLEQRSG